MIQIYPDFINLTKNFTRIKYFPYDFLHKPSISYTDAHWNRYMYQHKEKKKRKFLSKSIKPLRRGVGKGKNMELDIFVILDLAFWFILYSYFVQNKVFSKLGTNCSPNKYYWPPPDIFRIMSIDDYTLILHTS